MWFLSYIDGNMLNFYDWDGALPNYYVWLSENFMLLIIILLKYPHLIDVK